MKVILYNMTLTKHNPWLQSTHVSVSMSISVCFPASVNTGTHSRSVKSSRTVGSPLSGHSCV